MDIKKLIADIEAKQFCSNNKIILNKNNNLHEKMKAMVSMEEMHDKIKAMLGMLGGAENICGWLFMMQLLPLGYHRIRKSQSLSQSEAGRYGWNTDC